MSDFLEHFHFGCFQAQDVSRGGYLLDREHRSLFKGARNRPKLSGQAHMGIERSSSWLQDLFHRVLVVLEAPAMWSQRGVACKAAGMLAVAWGSNLVLLTSRNVWRYLLGAG
jgi:hypothetical protein